jgi:hypothetical protein
MVEVGIFYHNLVYFADIWYIWWRISIFLPVLVSIAVKNLATLGKIPIKIWQPWSRRGSCFHLTLPASRRNAEKKVSGFQNADKKDENVQFILPHQTPQPLAGVWCPPLGEVRVGQLPSDVYFLMSTFCCLQFEFWHFVIRYVRLRQTT